MKRPVILCVDDEPNILKSIERSLSLGDYDVILSSSGAEALQLLEERQGAVDLVIADYRMPLMTGEEFLTEVQKRYVPIRAIMLSGHTDSDALMRLVNSGKIFYFMVKPWDNEDLLRAVNAAITKMI